MKILNATYTYNLHIQPCFRTDFTIMFWTVIERNNITFERKKTDLTTENHVYVATDKNNSHATKFLIVFTIGCCRNTNQVPFYNNIL
jgi:hypothetical protein